MEKITYITAEEARELSKKGKERMYKQELDTIYNKIFNSCDQGENQIYHNIKYQSTVTTLRESGFIVDPTWTQISWRDLDL